MGEMLKNAVAVMVIGLLGVILLLPPIIRALLHSAGGMS